MKRLFAAVLCLCLVLCGCGRSGDDPYIPTGSGLEYDPEYTGPQVTPENNTTPKDLSLPYYKEKTLNPYTCADFTNRVLFSLLYQSLFIVDRDYTVQPQLCKNFSVSQDMKTYTFYLENATFSDGTPVTAEDVAASLNTARESVYYKGRFFHIKEILVEGQAVTIHLNVPYEDLPILLDIPIVPAAQVASDRPIGSGPYTLYAAATGESLHKRTDWWCNAKLPVTADVVTLVSAKDAKDIRDYFQFSDLSMACTDPGSDRYVDYQCDYELWDAENGIFLYLATSTDSEVFQNDGVRIALTHAIDRNTLVSEFYRGFAQAATLPASPSSPYYSQVLAKKYGYDSEKFAQAVSNAGFVEKEIVFMVNKDDSLRLRVARSIAKMLEAGGLKVKMKEIGGNSYVEALKTRQYDIYLGQTRLSPNMDLTAFFHTYGELSWGGVNDVGAYALCLQALENHGNYFTLHKQVMDQGLLCPVLLRNYAIFTTRGVVSDLLPARDNLFYYSMGRNLESAKLAAES